MMNNIVIESSKISKLKCAHPINFGSGCYVNISWLLTFTPEDLLLLKTYLISMSTPIGKTFTAGVEGYLCRNETIIFEENMLTVSAHFVFILLK